MIGPKPTLLDIDLFCHETLQLSDEEDTPVVQPAVDQLQQPFEIQLGCAYCSVGLRLVVAASPSAIRILNRLLLLDFGFLCNDCSDSIQDGSNHGG
ncbi:E7 [Boa constrictor papillomavirus 1]|uniref:E7 n=1 Tax=Boa constrictor papillomavirus 1 TaxID=2294156 RepID=UPI000E32E36C|nr:E7 [Boa constrictor papillomavirus 1]AXL96273.1 E7 [Boa constrictor papillomavirus 1]